MTASFRKACLASEDFLICDGRVFERTASPGPHGTITFVDGECWGDVSTRRPPERFLADTLVGSQARYELVEAWYKMMRSVSAAILALS